LDAYGNPVRIGTVLVIDPAQSTIVTEIFECYGAGETTVAIATELNRRGVPSAGSTWNRKTRRASGWMFTSVRVILKNPLYTGQQRWNATQFVRDPDTNKYLRRHRPKSEWITHQIEELRIVSDDVFQRAQARSKSVSSADPRLKSGGKSKYLLSGLLRCESCGAHYIIADKFKYACSSFLGGGNCTNGVYVRRDALEDAILGPIRNGLRDPAVVASMAAAIEADF
jgi:site-specific DNA recombinase